LGLIPWVLAADSFLTAFRAFDFSRFVSTEDCHPLFASLTVEFYVALTVLSWWLRPVWKTMRGRDKRQIWKQSLITIHTYLLFPVMFLLSLDSLSFIFGFMSPVYCDQQTCWDWHAVGERCDHHTDHRWPDAREMELQTCLR
jgi:hypothetical protein